ncbi:hypothetical protein M3484_19965 [Pseudomonas sp. GX19020]|uniref:hypothetical protein n=1 Tax=Pseudomonas sp. GX19020 TaxID=2942277 RepID=UPI00201845FD|nr:hypothetical protein [Pseudomonas sp. GX19020]MCL4068840.1 hypothetical protein [Pseudomonas sp. GX19020]
MQEKPGDCAEQELLILIQKLHAELGPVPRIRLSVVGRGRGLDVARLLVGLKAAGLVEEYETKPGWFGWLLGRRREMVLRPLTVPVESPEPNPGLIEDSAAQETAETPAEHFDPVPLTAGPAAEAAVPEPEPELVAEPLPDPIPMAPPEPDPRLTASAIELPPSVQTRPRPVPVGYADDIGGVPMAVQAAQLSASLDPDLLEGLRDFLVTLGIELTSAGEALVADRMNRGAPAGDALMQLVLFAFAHLARFDEISASPADPAELRDYTHAVLTELERLRDAGEISEARFDQDRHEILILADSNAHRAPLIERLFMDPFGGMAPPALLPAELRGVEEFEEDDTLS